MTHSLSESAARAASLPAGQREPVGVMDPAEYARSRAGFWGGSAVLFTDTRGRVLLVDPVYRPGTLLLPGGGMDQHEHPSAAAARESTEELGLTPALTRLLAVDWVSRDHPELAEVYGFPGEAQFVWDGGELADHEIERIRLPADELAGYLFLPPAEAAARMFPLDARRMIAALRARIDGAGPEVLQDGEPVGAPSVLHRARVVPRPSATYRDVPWYPDTPVPSGLPAKQAWLWAFTPDGRVVVLVDPRDGHVVLPGGTVEPTDRDPAATAVRECAEEAALRVRDVTYIGYLLDGDGSVYGPGTGPNARTRFIARAESLGPAAKDTATGATYGRLLVSPRQAADLLGLGRAGREQAQHAARAADARWGIGLSGARQAEEISPGGAVLAREVPVARKAG
ncbi:NUDIX hydrolase [Streptomyces sp. NPDC051569]|uniref:NUDIX hydrolase n=1 Tax=Streptomyces sp. NPDC051569 TaxID=3365661 RepID=UPI0037AB37AA